MLIVLHELEEFGGCFTAKGEVVGEVDERKCCNGNEICQTTKGSNAGLFDRKSTFDVLEKDFDLPAVVVGVGGEDGGFAHRFLSPVFLDEVGGVKVDGGVVEGGRNDENGVVCFVGWKKALAPSDDGVGFVCRRG